jgi:hypothetical protein
MRRTEKNGILSDAVVVSGVSVRFCGPNNRNATRAEIPSCVERLVAADVLRTTLAFTVDDVERNRFRLLRRLTAASSARRTRNFEPANQHTKRAHLLLQKKKARCDIPDGEVFPPGKLNSYRPKPEVFKPRPLTARRDATHALPVLQPSFVRHARTIRQRSRYRASSVGE